MSYKVSIEELSKLLINNGGLNIVAINLENKTNIANFIIIATATSSKHAETLAYKTTELLKSYKYTDIITQGLETGNWVVIDANDFIIHIFKEEVRNYYQIEKIWNY